MPAKWCFHDVVSYDKAFPIHMQLGVTSYKTMTCPGSVHQVFSSPDIKHLIVALSINRDGFVLPIM